MSQDRFLERVFFQSRPKTYRALQRLVMAAAKAHNNFGKKGIFGGDKFIPAYTEFKRSVFELCEAIDIDGDMIMIHTSVQLKPIEYQLLGIHRVVVCCAIFRK